MNAIEKAVNQAARISDCAAADQNTQGQQRIQQAQVDAVEESSNLARLTDSAPIESPATSAVIVNNKQNSQSFIANPKPKFEEIDTYLFNKSSSSTVDRTDSSSMIVSERELSNYIELPLNKLKSAGCISLDDPRSQTAEEYRHIKRPILSNLKTKDSECNNIVMVTSSVEGEGKTFTSLNLALSIAMERNKTVLLIDADPAKGSLGSMLGFSPGAPGLIDLLTGKVARFTEILHQTNVPDLRVVPVGENNQHATEILASEGMQSLVLELSQRYSDRVIILDAPPVIPTTESKVLAGLAGQIVFVVEAERTSQSTVTEALRYIDPEKSIGLVLNKTKHKNMPGYGYNYNYGNSKTSNPVSQRR